MPRGDILTKQEAKVYHESNKERSVRAVVLAMTKHREFRSLAQTVQFLYHEVLSEPVQPNKQCPKWRRILGRFKHIRRKFPEHHMVIHELEADPVQKPGVQSAEGVGGTRATEECNQNMAIPDQQLNPQSVNNTVVNYSTKSQDARMDAKPEENTISHQTSVGNAQWPKPIWNPLGSEPKQIDLISTTSTNYYQVKPGSNGQKNMVDFQSPVNKPLLSGNPTPKSETNALVNYTSGNSGQFPVRNPALLSPFHAKDDQIIPMPGPIPATRDLLNPLTALVPSLTDHVRSSSHTMQMLNATMDLLDMLNQSLAANREKDRLLIAYLKADAWDRGLDLQAYM